MAGRRRPLPDRAESRNGDVQVVFDGHSVRAYDGTSNTLYTLALPPRRAGPDRTSGRERQRPPTLAEISRAFARLSGAAHVSGARPASVADRPAYEVTLSPRRDGGLLGPVSLAWDAIRGVPLRVVLRARGSDRPVLALEATEVSYAAVPPSVLRASNPPGARHERLALPAVGAGAAEPAPPLTGRRQAAARLGFPLAAPARLAGRQRHAVRLLPHRSGALVLYGRGLDGIAVLETPASAAWDRELTRLPAVSVGGVRAHQLTTALGSVIAWRSGGVRYTLAASMRAAAAQAAARQLSATATR